MNNCGGNGICDGITATCTCFFSFDPATGCTTQLPTSSPVPEPVVVKQSASAPVAYFVGVGILGVIVGALLFGVIGFYLAVKYMEKKRDALMKGKKGDEE